MYTINGIAENNCLSGDITLTRTQPLLGTQQADSINAQEINYLLNNEDANFHIEDEVPSIIL